MGIFIFVALYNWRKERKEKLIKILNEQTILLILNKQAILKIDKYRSSNFYESIKKHLRDVSDFINSIRLNLWKEVHTCITILIPRSLSRGKKIRVRRRTKSQGVWAKIKEAQDDARIPWWPWKQKEASSFVSRGHTLVCRGIIRLWLDIISIETSYRSEQGEQDRSSSTSNGTLVFWKRATSPRRSSNPAISVPHNLPDCIPPRRRIIPLVLSSRGLYLYWYISKERRGERPNRENSTFSPLPLLRRL